MAKTVASAVKPGGQAMRPVFRAFLLVQGQRAAVGARWLVRWLRIYIDNGTVFLGAFRCTGR